MADPVYRFAYLHGLASGPRARKGVYLEKELARRGIELALPDLHRPSFDRLTVSGSLAALDALAATATAAAVGRPAPVWRLIGSSYGGYVAARWAELHPERVDRLLLLCPGFDLLGRWPGAFGAQVLARWERDGALVVPYGTSRPVSLHWGFVEDLRRHPATPEVPCPTRIVHGRRDPVVPITTSRRYAATRPHVELIEVDDDHGLMGSLGRIGREVEGWLVDAAG